MTFIITHLKGFQGKSGEPGLGFGDYLGFFIGSTIMAL
jgi:hypothetical protein